MNYRKLYTISILHEYFDWEYANNLVIKPTRESQGIFNKQGFLIKQEDSKITVLSNHEDITDYLTYINQTSSINAFEFEIIPTSTEVYAYTALTDDPLTSTYSYNSLSENTESSKSIELIPSVKSSENSNAIAQIQISFDSVSEEDKKYLIKLNSKKSTWEYFIINQNNIELTNTSIEGKSEVIFSRKEEVELVNGQRAIPFIMENDSLPLKNKMDNTFNLVRTISDRKKVLYKGLPMAEPNNLKITSSNGMKIYQSPIYVYI